MSSPNWRKTEPKKVPHFWSSLGLLLQLSEWLVEWSGNAPAHGSGCPSFVQPLPIQSALGMEHALAPKHSFQEHFFSGHCGSNPVRAV